MSMELVNRRIQNFDCSHGNDGINIKGWVLFSDGAMREVNPLGAFHEPPASLRERLGLQVKYHEELLRRATVSFSELKQQLTAVAKTCFEGPSPPPMLCDANLRKLRELQKRVTECQARVAEARERYTRCSSDQPRYAELAQNRSLGQQYLDELSQISI